MAVNTSSGTSENFRALPSRRFSQGAWEHFLLVPILFGLFCLLASGRLYGQEKPKDAENRPLLVGIDKDYPPFESLDEKGNPTGFDVDLIRAIANVMGLNIRIVGDTWSRQLEGLRDGRIDIMPGMMKNELRERFADFTKPYLMQQYSLFRRKESLALENIEDLRGRTVLVGANTEGHDYLKAHYFGTLVQTTPTEPDALRLLAAGTGDAALLPHLEGMRLIRDSRLDNLRPGGKPVFVIPSCIAVRKGNTGLRDRLEQGLVILDRTGRFDQIHNKWFGKAEIDNHVFSQLLRTFGLVILALIISVGLILIWNSILRRRVQQHTQELRAALEANRLSQQQLSLIFETVNDVLFLLAVEPENRFRFISINPAFCRITGLKPECIIGKWIEDVLPDEALAVVVPQYLSAIREKRTVSWEEVSPYPTGTLSGIVSVIPAIGEDGICHHLIGSVHDITDIRRAESSLRESENRYRTVLQTAMDGTLMTDLDGNILEANAAFCSLTGYTAEELKILNIQEMEAPHSPSSMSSRMQAIAEKGDDRFESHFRRKDGTPVEIEISAQYIPDGSGRIFSFHRDITDRKQAELSLKRAHHLLDSIVENLPAMIFLKDARELRFERFNKAGEELLGYSRESLLGKNDYDFFPEEQADFFIAKDREVLEGRQAIDIPKEPITNRTGETRYLHTKKVPLLGSDGMPEYLLGISEDISEHCKSQEALKDSEQKFSAVFHITPDPMFITNTSTGVITEVNGAFERFLGWRRGEAIGRTLQELGLLVAPQAAEHYFDVSQREGRIQKLEILARLRDGQIHWMELSGESLELKGENCFLTVARDIQERKLAEIALQQSRDRLESAQAQAHLGSWELDLESGKLDWSNEVYRIFELDPDRFESSYEAFLGAIHPEDREPVSQAFQKSLKEHTPYRCVHRLSMPDGRIKYVQENCQTLFDPKGNPLRSLGTVQDISETVRLEEERANMQARIDQIQKLESLGSLAGGVAHDINNVLGAIMGIASLHIELEPEGSALQESMHTIERACQRGSKLVKGLLDFARPGLTEARVIDLNRIINEEVALLERTTLQKIRLTMDLDPSLGTVTGDASALSHAIMNLCVNAVDAMPGGGDLIIRTRNGPDEILLEVQDTGEGMSPDVMKKAMDPFFTTKPQGKGTGLGLSLVYGTVKAHRGRLELQSKVNDGTKVSIWLPIHGENDGLPQPQPASALRTIRPKRVLLVDDDELVRTAVGRLLGALKHDVTFATCAEECLKLLEDGLEVDGIILDVNMPGMGGTRALPMIKALRPGMPVLFTTGYSDQNLTELAESYEGTQILYKPFGIHDFGEMLDRW